MRTVDRRAHLRHSGSTVTFGKYCGLAIRQLRLSCQTERSEPDRTGSGD